MPTGSVPWKRCWKLLEVRHKGGLASTRGCAIQRFISCAVTAALLAEVRFGGICVGRPSPPLTPKRASRPCPALSPAFCPLCVLPGWPQKDSHVTNDVNDRVSYTLTGRALGKRARAEGSIVCAQLILKNNCSDFIAFILLIIAGVDPRSFTQRSHHGSSVLGAWRAMCIPCAPSAAPRRGRRLVLHLELYVVCR